MLTKGNVLFSIADHPTPKINTGGTAYTLESRDYKNAQCVVTKEYVNVEMEVTKRKYEVDIPKLIECLNRHKTISITEIAERLDKPKTMVEHWFRKDKYFAIPDADIWLQLKDLLGIETTEFDKSIMTFEIDGSKYDMSGRIYYSDVSPTLTADGKGNLHLMNENKEKVLFNTYKKSSHAKSSDDGQGWEETEVNDTLNVFDSGESRTPTVIIEKQTVYDWHRQDTRMTECGDICVTAAAGWGGGGNNMPYVLEERTMEESKEPVLLESNQNHATIREDGISTSLVASAGEGGGYVPMVTQGINGDTAGTLDSNYFKGCGEREGTEREVVCVGNGQLAQLKMSDKAHALDCMHDQQAVMENLVVRRLTPKECSRLQGYPDGWMDIGEWTDSKGKLHKDSDAPKYKAAGNSIALPFWQWLMDRIAKQLKKDGCGNPTMASLFDGISGFPLCATRSGIKPVWSSEIEEFPMAVAERHFGENGDIEKFL